MVKVKFQRRRDKWRYIVRMSLLRLRDPMLILGIVLALVGLALSILGLKADSGHWWADEPFLTNMVSGVASACFGIPFALVVLARLNVRQLRQVRDQEARSLRSHSFHDLKSRIQNVQFDRDYSEATLLDLQILINECNISARRTLRAAEKARLTKASAAVYVDLPIHGSEDDRRAAYRNFCNFMNASDEVGEYISGSAYSPYEGQQDWVTFCTDWRFIEGYVKNKVIEAGQVWLPRDLVHRIEVLVAAPNPYEALELVGYGMPIGLKEFKNDGEDAFFSSYAFRIESELEEALERVMDAIRAVRCLNQAATLCNDFSTWTSSHL